MIRSRLVSAVVGLACVTAPVAGPAALAQAATPAPGASTAPAWVVDAPASRIAFTTTWAGQKVVGQFSAWSADIRFDPANLARSRAVVTITTASARTGQKDPDANLQDKDWFNPKSFPAARFETVAIRSLGGGRFEADSRVTIRGVTAPAVLAFTLTIKGASAQMAGTATLDRLAFGLGSESDPKAEWVDRQVRVDVTLKATRKP